MPEGMAWDAIPAPLLTDCAQLVKANSIEGGCVLRAGRDGVLEFTGLGCREQEG
jgi:hypothetical protein